MRSLFYRTGLLAIAMLLLLPLLSGCGLVKRGSPGRGVVTGLVRSFAGDPVSGLTVSIGTTATLTDEHGAFRLEGVPEGARTITVTAQAVVPEERRLNVAAGPNVVSDLRVWPRGRVAYVSEQGTGIAQVFVVNGEDRQVQQVLHDLTPVSVAAISPDGLDIAYASPIENGGMPSVWASSLDESSLQLLGANIEWPWFSAVAWSPEQDRVAAFDASHRTLFLMFVDGRDVANPPRWEVLDWPNITQLTWTRDPLDPGRQWIYLANQADGALYRLSPSDLPPWDGVSVVDITDSHLTKVYDGAAGSVSPDGQEMVAATDDDRLVVISLANPAAPARVIFERTAETGDIRVGNPVWRLDGQAVVFEGDFYNNTDIFVIGADGRGLMRVTNNDKNRDWDAQAGTWWVPH